MSFRDRSIFALKLAAYAFFGVAIYGLFTAPAFAAAISKSFPLNVLVYGLLALVVLDFSRSILRLFAKKDVE